MNRGEAEQVFALVADLHGELRDRLVTSRWWLIWMIMGAQTFVSCAISHVIHRHDPSTVFQHDLVWAGHVTLMLLYVRIIQRRTGGLRTDRERLLWAIWLSFVVAASSTRIVNQLMGLAPFTLLPMAGIVAAFAFAMTAVAVHRLFWVGAGVFAGVTIAMAMLPRWQLLIWGAAWFVTLECLGLVFARSARLECRPL